MDERDTLNRRDFLQTAGAAGTATALAGAALTPAQAAEAQPPAGFVDQPAFKNNWPRPLSEVVDVNLKEAAPELADEAIKERHRIYCYLLMKLIHRFWNGNKHGPMGNYFDRKGQLEQVPNDQVEQARRYQGDMIKEPDSFRIKWDRYLGHNIACVAVDGNGEIIDFDFNHNEFFRSSAEHAESRMVRRLFSLTDIFDGWKTGSKPRSHRITLSDVTLYTSLESCAQCSGVMSLAGIKQIVYLQNDFTAYMIGNIMFNLARDKKTGRAQAPTPIPGSAIGLTEFADLNKKNIDFINDIKGKAFFDPKDGSLPDTSDDSITSFLCTDAAHDIFEAGGKKLDTMVPTFKDRQFPIPSNDEEKQKILTNDQCLRHAQAFFKYADQEGYRGSPHKL